MERDTENGDIDFSNQLSLKIFRQFLNWNPAPSVENLRQNRENPEWGGIIVPHQQIFFFSCMEPSIKLRTQAYVNLTPHQFNWIFNTYVSALKSNLYSIIINR